MGQFSHPISLVQSSRSIQRIDSTIVPKLFLFCMILCWKFGYRTILCFTDQETQEENLQDGTSSLVGQFLHPVSLVQSSRFHSAHADSPIIPKHFLNLVPANLDVGPVCFTDQETQEENFRMELAPLWAGSDTQSLL